MLPIYYTYLMFFLLYRLPFRAISSKLFTTGRETSKKEVDVAKEFHLDNVISMRTQAALKTEEIVNDAFVLYCRYYIYI